MGWVRTVLSQEDSVILAADVALRQRGKPGLNSWRHGALCRLQLFDASGQVRFDRLWGDVTAEDVAQAVHDVHDGSWVVWKGSEVGIEEMKLLRVCQEAHHAVAELPEDVTVPGTVRDAASTLLTGATRSGRRKRLKREMQHYIKRYPQTKILAESFSPPRVTAESKGRTWPCSRAFDITTGQDLLSKEGEADMWRCIGEDKPHTIMMSPECRAFSCMMCSNWDRMNTDKRTLIEQQGLQQLLLCVRVALYQIRKGRTFIIEHPASASNWETELMQHPLAQEGVMVIKADQCMYGLQVSEDGLSRKHTRFVTNGSSFSKHLAQRCDRRHDHVQLQGKLTKLAQVYPEELVKAIADGAEESFVHWIQRQAQGIEGGMALAVA